MEFLPKYSVLRVSLPQSAARSSRLPAPSSEGAKEQANSLTRSGKDTSFDVSFQIVKKASQNFVRKDETKFKSIFRRDMCVTKNTNRAASVEFVCLLRTNYARGSPASPIASAGASLSKCSVGVF